MINKEHPYILFDINKIIELRTIAVNGCNYKYRELVKQCDKYIMESPYASAEPKWYIYTDMFYNNIRNKIVYLSLAYILSGESRYADEAKREIYFVMDHIVGMRYVLQKSLDYNAGIIAGSLGIAYDWLYNYFTIEERGKVRKGLILTILDVYLECADTGKFPWCDSYTTSTAVINGGIGVAILAVYNEWKFAPKASAICSELINKYFFDKLPMDGGFIHGVNQWRIAMGQALLYLNALQTSTGNNDLFSSKWFRNIGVFPLYFAPYGDPVGFGELNQKMIPRYDFANWIFYNLSAKTQNPIYAWYRDMYLSTDYLELLWDYKVDSNFTPDLPRFKLFRSIGWCFASSNLYDADQISVSFRNGWSKGQNLCKDLNSFIVKAYGQKIIYDPGLIRQALPEEHTDPEIRSHNTIVVNGKGQVECDGDLSLFEEENGCVRITGDASQAYGNLLSKFTRNIIIVDSKYILLIDEIEANNEQKVQWIFHTSGDVIVSDNGLKFKQKRANLMFYINECNNFSIKKKDRAIPSDADNDFQLMDTAIIIESNDYIKKNTFVAVLNPYIDLKEVAEFKVDKMNDHITITIEKGKGSIVISFWLKDHRIERLSSDNNI